MIGYNIPVQVAADGWGRGGALGRYGPFGPPFKDAELQRTYNAEWRKLSASSIAITDATARSLVATVINSALAAGEASIPKIKNEVRREVLRQIPRIKREVRQEVLKQVPYIRTEAEGGAKTGVKNVLVGAGVLVVMGIGAYAFFSAKE